MQRKKQKRLKQKRIAGHKNMSTTLRYLSARDDQLIEAADILGRKVNEAIR